MKRMRMWVEMLAASGLLAIAGAGLARAGTLEGMAAWAEQSGPERAASEVARLGVKNEADAEAIVGGWDEQTVVERSLAAGAYGLLIVAGRRDGFSARSVQQITAAIEAEADPPTSVVDLIGQLPATERGRFEGLLYDLAPLRWPEQPVIGRHVVKYAILGDTGLFSARTAPEDVVAVLLAPEPLNMRYADSARKALRDGAVVLARNWFHYSGQSFVVRDGVNPLVEAVRPVVEALNAPGCVGLEAALRGLGADVPDHDRAGLNSMAAAWQDEILSGERSGSSLTAVLGKLSVVLGVEGFNALVERYNYGTGGVGQ